MVTLFPYDTVGITGEVKDEVLSRFRSNLLKLSRSDEDFLLFLNNKVLEQLHLK